ncbi:hypothetical protein CEUSTIGMA_g4563.t1 [Chlamydomonas eustigma]|uniref:RING-type domain-containing protein n=1 Tax=Chlamydomonas eustigma TaxID=1157962 RepID=A0A250X211_9CHLO|nr:hypothetical protein CEUSTIGMA_g4563.t1 [Chlamydomonas eustigma]|eukprot:GAX77117.1 hypothetical protein CEUSTIGMA_g4563.t1 [Chlamydomonas eustigma]
MSALADSSACCGGSEDDSKSSLLPIGVSPRDLQCPICVETIQDAFVTSCGHSFCYACLITHLQNRNSCPSCGTYVTHDLIYPNFLLNKILSQAAAASGTSASSRLPSSATRLAEIVRRTLDSEPSKVRLEDLDAVIATLQDRRVEVSSQQRVSMLLLLQAFLKHAKLCKEKQVQQLQSHLLLLDQDLKTVVHMQQQQQQRAQPPHKHLSTHQGHLSLPAVSSPAAPHLPSVGNSSPSKTHTLAGSSQGNVILVQRQATAEATAAAAAAAAVAAAGADCRTVHVHRILESGALSTVSIQDIGGLQNSNQALIESMKPDVGSEAVMSAKNGHVVTAQASHLVAPLLQAWDPMQNHMKPSCLDAHSTEPSPAYIETDHTRDVGSQRRGTTASSLMEQPCQVSKLWTSSSASDDDEAGGRIRSKKSLLHKSQNGQHHLAGSRSNVDKHHNGGKAGTRMGEIKGDESALKRCVDKSVIPKNGKELQPGLYLSSEEHCFFGGQQDDSLVMGMPPSGQSMVNNYYSNIIDEGNIKGSISMQQRNGSKQQVSALSQVNGINGMESMKHTTHASASGDLHPSCDLLKQHGVLLQEPLQAGGASTQAEVRWHGGVSSVGTAATSSSLIGDENDISAPVAHKRQRLCVEQLTAEPSRDGFVARKRLSLTSPQLHLIQSDGNSVELADSCYAAFSNNKQMTSVSETYSLSNKQMSCIAEVQRPSQSAAASGGAGAARGSILSSIEFDMEERNFAVAGVSARISIYDYNAVLAACQHHSSQLGEGSSDQHRMSAHHNQASSGAPNTTAAGLLAEIHTRSKLTCLSYSAQHKESLIAGDYDGVVTLWDTSTQQSINEFDGHDRRIWSTDFCTNHAGDTSAFASGSDDGTVKVWSIKSDKCTAVLNIKANVCSVRWNPWDEHQVAVGCAAHTLLIYDLRNNKQALATLKGHKKAVSYVRFLSRCEVVSASIDNSLKVWNTQWLHTSCTKDLPQILGHCSMPNTAHDAVDCNALAVDPKHSVEGPGTACVRTFTGHVNERNFVGLSTCGDMIACGSESNEVHLYHKAVAGSLGSYSFSASTLPPALPAGISTQLGHSSSYIQHESSLSNRLLSLNNGVALKLRTPSQSHCFITALCWRLSSQTLVAANSHGQLRILGMSKLD